MIKPDDNVRLLFCLKMKINVLGSDISGAAVPIYYYPINNNRQPRMVQKYQLRLRRLMKLKEQPKNVMSRTFLLVLFIL